MIKQPNSSIELAVVRVVFYKPGDLLRASQLDGGITDYSLKHNRHVDVDDYADLGIYRLSSYDLSGSFFNSVYAADPHVEVLIPLTVVYVKSMETTGDGGFLGWFVDALGVWETYNAHCGVFVEHAKTLLRDSEPRNDGFGETVCFMVKYRCSFKRSYFVGEYDYDIEPLGWFDCGDVNARPFVV